MPLPLDHHDALVYAEDLRLLSPGQWVNDRIINFCFRYYEHTDPVLPKRILLVDPAVVSFLRIQCTSQSDYQELFAGLELGAREYLLLPCSDSTDFESVSTHWSLLVFHVPSRRAMHLDSSGKYNLKSAQHLVEKLCDIFSLPAGSIDLDCPKSPQQANGYDCGIHAILAARHIAIGMSNSSGLVSLEESVASLPLSVSPDSATSYRSALIQIIEDMAALKK
jgi:sentrin-specific protease 8